MSFSVARIIYLLVAEALWKKTCSAGRFSHGSRAQKRLFFTDYCLWSTFRPESIDIDGELDMECLDSGMVLFKECCTPQAALESSYRQAFGKDFCENDVIQLLSS